MKKPRIDTLYKSFLLIVVLLLLFQGHKKNLKYSKISYEKSLMEIRHNQLKNKHFKSCANLFEKTSFSAITNLDSAIIIDDNTDHQKPMLMFRLPDGACEACIRKDFETFFKTIDSLKIPDFHIIGSFKSYFEFQSFKRVIKYDFETGNLKKGESLASFDSHGLPYFCLYQEHTVSHIFYPDQLLTDLTLSYLKDMGNYIHNYY